MKRALLGDGLEVKSFNGSLLHSPTSLRNRSGKPFQVFTPFWKHCLSLPVRSVTRLPAGPLPQPVRWPDSEKLEDFALKPAVPWDREFFNCWKPGEEGARAAMARFVAKAVEGYADARDRPDLRGTSRLSPHLHRGEISPAQIWHAVQRASRGRGAQVFLGEVCWREFAHHLLFHFPHTTTEPLRTEFARFPWREDETLLHAWQRGQTGYPIVDAGMRQLWRTGWMHNRVRMIAASFLVKHLLQPWTAGARWFLGHARRCRPREQHGGLAMDGRLRRGCHALLSRLQSPHAGRKVRSRRQLRARVRAGAGATSGEAHPHALDCACGSAGGRERAAGRNVSAADRGPRDRA